MNQQVHTHLLSVSLDQHVQIVVLVWIVRLRLIARALLHGPPTSDGDLQQNEHDFRSNFGHHKSKKMYMCAH
jgi:hypothetical protein